MQVVGGKWGDGGGGNGAKISQCVYKPEASSSFDKADVTDFTSLTVCCNSLYPLNVFIDTSIRF